MRLPMPADRCVDKPPPGLVKAPLQSTPAQVAELVDALASGASGRKVVKVRVLSWAPFVLPRTSGDVQKMAEIRHFPCYNRPVKSGRIRHQSGTMGVYPRVSFSVLLQDDTPMSTLFATTVANAKPQDRDYKLSDGGGLYLLVRDNGAKLWRINYRYLETRSEEHTSELQSLMRHT